MRCNLSVINSLIPSLHKNYNYNEVAFPEEKTKIHMGSLFSRKLKLDSNYSATEEKESL